MCKSGHPMASFATLIGLSNKAIVDSSVSSVYQRLAHKKHGIVVLLNRINFFIFFSDI